MDRQMAVKVPRADYISIFDGEGGALNDVAAVFGLTGLPPANIA